MVAGLPTCSPGASVLASTSQDVVGEGKGKVGGGKTIANKREVGDRVSAGLVDLGHHLHRVQHVVRVGAADQECGELCFSQGAEKKEE